VKVEVGRGRGVDEAVAGCVSGTKRVGRNNSDVGVATVPHKDGDCLQEVNIKAPMNRVAMNRLTWNPC
jgi:hypothetical protein